MISFVGFLLENWRYVVVLILIVAAATYIGLLQHDMTKVSKLNTQLTSQVADLTTTNKNMQSVYEQRITQLSSAIGVQNQNITDYQNQVADLQKAVATATSAATSTRVTYDAAAQTILTDTTINETTTCPASIKYLVDGVQDLKW